MICSAASPGQASPLSVLNAGISGNRVLQGPPSIFGPSGLGRFRADALSEPGVADVIVLEGINDIGQTPGITAAQLINGYKRIIHQAHAAHIAIQLGTLTPSGATSIPSYGGRRGQHAPDHCQSLDSHPTPLKRDHRLRRRSPRPR